MVKEFGLDLKDRKILYELDKNSRISLAKLSRKVRLSKEVVFHRMNNLLKKGYILRFQAVISSYRLGYQSYKLYFKLQNIDSETQERINIFLLKHKKVYWVGNCQGRWDLISAIWVKNNREFAEFEDEVLNKFSKYIQERQVSISRKSVQFNRRWFYSDEEIIETNFGEDLEEIKLDEIDMKILEYLAENSRIKMIDLADKIKTSLMVIRYRIKQLQERGVIVGYKCSLNPKLMNYETCKSLIYFKGITEEKRKQIIDYCKSFKNVINVVLTIGSWDMEIEMEVKNFEEYYQIMKKIQDNFKEIIKNYESVLLSSEPKQIFIPLA
jgi:DNA-binding Lrp family transcriptional regulator